VAPSEEASVLDAIALLDEPDESLLYRVQAVEGKFDGKALWDVVVSVSIWRRSFKSLGAVKVTTPSASASDI
jgi:hypothetical protein